MSRPRNETPTIKVTVNMRPSHVNELDAAALAERVKTGIFIDRSALIAAIVESVDIPKIAAQVAKGRASS